MPATVSTPTPPGYGTIVPILFALASVALFVSCLGLLGRNRGFAAPDTGADRGRVLGYVEDVHAAEGQVLEFELVSSRLGNRPLILKMRDDRPWRTFAPGEEVRLLRRMVVSPRGYAVTEYIIDDFAAKWGGLIARAGAAALCDIIAVAALILGRRRRSAAARFPPPLRGRPIA